MLSNSVQLAPHMMQHARQRLKLLTLVQHAHTAKKSNRCVCKN